jgi:hypothetical protein
MRVLGLDRRDVHSAIRATLCVSVFVARRTVRGCDDCAQIPAIRRRLGEWVISYPLLPFPFGSGT